MALDAVTNKVDGWEEDRGEGAAKGAWHGVYCIGDRRVEGSRRAR